jgi:hypothetical protein
MSDDGRRQHQVRGVCSGSPENHWVTQLSHKAEAEDWAWLSGQNRPDRLGSQGVRSFEAEDTRRDLKACVEATRSAVAGHPSDGAYEDNFPKCLW